MPKAPRGSSPTHLAWWLVFVAIVGSGCVTLVPDGSRGSGTLERPLVTLVATLSEVPTARPEDQWTNITRQVAKPIPDDSSVGVQDAALTIDTGDDVPCSRLFGIEVQIWLTHPRPTDLVITLQALSRPGNVISGVAVLWDGPALARATNPGDPPPLFPREFSASSLVPHAKECSRWRLSVDDRRKDRTGTLLQWMLRRRIALDVFGHSPDYYRELLFGGNGRTPNVQDYFLEVSRRRFTFSNAGILSTGMSHAEWFDAATDELKAQNCVLALERAKFDFLKFDRNQDGRISADELAILVIKNDAAAGGAHRPLPSPSQCIRLTQSPLDVCTTVVFAGHQPDFDTLTHELSHALGAVDLYGRWAEGDCFSDGLTLMSCSRMIADDTRTLYLDPWHRTKLGWLAPYAATLPYEMGDETWTDLKGARSRPAIVRNSHDPNEYYLFEYRGRRGYDRDVAGVGIIAWHIVEDRPGEPIKGRFGYADGINAVGPEADFGASMAWTQADGRFMLPWRDGSLLPQSFWIEEPRNRSRSALLCSQPAPAAHQPPRVSILQPKDNAVVGTGWVTIEADADASVDDQRVQWSSSADGPLGAGRKRHELFAVPGKRVLTVAARDGFGARRSTSVTLTITNTPASVTIVAPQPNATLYSGQPVRLWGKASVPGAYALPADQLTWATDRLLPPWSQVGRTGESESIETVTFYYRGPVNLSLTATDAFGGSTTVSVPVTFVDPPADGPPLVTITSPSKPTNLLADRVQRLDGVVIDPAGGVVTSTWAVYDVARKVETILGPGPIFDWLPEKTLRIGSVEIRLYGANSRGVVAVDRLNAYIQAPLR